LYLDNGVLEIFLVLGWAGGLIFLASAAVAMWSALRNTRRIPWVSGYAAGAMALLAQVAGGTVFAGVGGALFWLATAMATNATARAYPNSGEAQA
jgi:hypothetical protein